MNTQFLIEAFGYLGSFLVLVSFLMTSVFKLRIVNTIGSVIFMIYAFIIKSYPTALMNAALVIINLNFLWKMSRINKEYEVVETRPDDELLNYFVKKYMSDIKSCFPGIEIDLMEINKAYVVMCQDKTVGITLGVLKDGVLDLKLDYTVPEYRDFSIGSFLFGHLAKQDITSATYSGPDENHQAYLKRQGFVKEENVYRKDFK